MQIPQLTLRRTCANVDTFKFCSDPAFIRIFRLSCSVDLQHWLLSPWIKNGRSKNGKQYVTANESLFFTLYFIIYGGIGFKIAAELNPSTALHELSALLAGVC